MRPFVIAMIAGLLASASAAGCGEDEGGDRTVTPPDEDGPPIDLALIEEGTLTVGSNIPYSPFEEGEPPDYEGFDIDLINAIAEKLDLDTEIEPAPFDLVLKGGDGRFDLAISAVEITPEREKRVDFSDPYFVSSLGLLVEEDSEVESIDDIASDTAIGVESGTESEAYVEENIDASEVLAFPSADDAFNALYSDQVDVVIAAAQAAESAAKTREGLNVAEIVPTQEEFGIVVPEGERPLLKAVNAALREVKDEGTLDELYDEYFGIEAPQALSRARHEPT